MSAAALPSGVGSSSARWLFSQHFLTERLVEWNEFVGLDATRLHDQLQELWKLEQATLRADANEGLTEERFIRPVLKELGHAFTLFPEIPGARRTPDYLFYATEAERSAAELGSPAAKVERALAVGDAKRFDLALDRRSADGDPVAQVRDYVLLSHRPFGILTNGRLWRLYARDSALVERACHEVDLVALLEEGDSLDLRYFLAFFGVQAFVPGTDGRTFLERALEDSELHAVEVSEGLEQAVFAAVPTIAEGLLGDEPRTRQSLDLAFANALVFLYRTLFCLFAEARDLLPVADPGYRHYSILQQRLEVASLLDARRYLSTTNDGLFAALRALFRMIDRGEAALGVTEYDGGLFDPAQHPWLEGRSVPDALLAPALDGIYRVGGEFVGLSRSLGANAGDGLRAPARMGARRERRPPRAGRVAAPSRAGVVLHTGADCRCDRREDSRPPRCTTLRGDPRAWACRIRCVGGNALRPRPRSGDGQRALPRRRCRVPRPGDCHRSVV